MRPSVTRCSHVKIGLVKLASSRLVKGCPIGTEGIFSFIMVHIVQSLLVLCSHKGLLPAGDPGLARAAATTNLDCLSSCYLDCIIVSPFRVFVYPQLCLMLAKRPGQMYRAIRTVSITISSSLHNVLLKDHRHVLGMLDVVIDFGAVGV